MAVHGGWHVKRQVRIALAVICILAAGTACGSAQSQPVLSWGPAHPLGSSGDAYVLSCSTESSCSLWKTHATPGGSSGEPSSRFQLSYVPVSQKNGAFVQESPENIPYGGAGEFLNGSQLTGSCARDGSVCMAYIALADSSATAVSGESDALFLRTKGGWKEIHLPLPERTDTASISGLSCTARSVCYVAGTTTLTGGAGEAYLARWVGSRWTVVSTVQGGTFGAFHDLSCNAADRCIAAYDAAQQLDLPYEPLYAVSGTTVTELRISKPQPVAGYAVAAVDCTHVVPCMALLSSRNAGTNSTSFRIASLSSSGIAVSSTTFSVGGLETPDAFSCFTRNYCVAVEEAAPGPGAAHAALSRHVSGIVWSSGLWKQSPSRELGSPIGAACSAEGICYVIATVHDAGAVSSTIQSLSQ